MSESLEYSTSFLQVFKVEFLWVPTAESAEHFFHGSVCVSSTFPRHISASFKYTSGASIMLLIAITLSIQVKIAEILHATSVRLTD